MKETYINISGKLHKVDHKIFEEKYPELVFDLVNNIRKRLGLTWDQLATETGYSKQTLKNAKYQPVSKRLIKAVRRLE